MTDDRVTECIIADCGHDALEGSAFCDYHREKMQAAEHETLELASRRINSELIQFERLMYEEPPLPVHELAFRMVWSEKDVRWLLRKFKDDRA